MIAPELFAQWERQRVIAWQRRDRDDVGATLEQTQVALARSSVALEHTRRQLELARAHIDRAIALRAARSS